MWTVHVALDVQISLAILNFLACTCFVIIRVYHHRKYSPEKPKLSGLGISCMTAGVLHCLMLINNNIEWYFGNVDRYCDLSMKLSALTYALTRALLYTFIIFRLEVVNQANFLKDWIIDTTKVVIGLFGIFIVVCSIAFTSGAEDEYWSCAFFVKEDVIIVLFLIDSFICTVGTYTFIRPFTKSLISLENKALRYMLKKTLCWSAVCLVSTMIGLLTLALVEGAGGVSGFDCTVTSFALLMMMYPVKDNVAFEDSKNVHDNLPIELKTDLTKPYDRENRKRANSNTFLFTKQIENADTENSLQGSTIIWNRQNEDVLFGYPSVELLPGDFADDKQIII